MGCCSFAKPCCSGKNQVVYLSKKTGYSEEELKTVPQGSNLWLGCGNPLSFVNLKEGDFILDPSSWCWL